MTQKLKCITWPDTGRAWIQRLVKKIHCLTRRQSANRLTCQRNNCPVPDMTYNVFGGTLNLTQSNPIYDNCRSHKTFTTSLGHYLMINLKTMSVNLGPGLQTTGTGKRGPWVHIYKLWQFEQIVVCAAVSSTLHDWTLNHQTLKVAEVARCVMCG